jgi:hypothetical protein
MRSLSTAYKREKNEEERDRGGQGEHSQIGQISHSGQSSRQKNLTMCCGCDCDCGFFWGEREQEKNKIEAQRIKTQRNLFITFFSNIRQI